MLINSTPINPVKPSRKLDQTTSTHGNGEKNEPRTTLCKTNRLKKQYKSVKFDQTEESPIRSDQNSVERRFFFEEPTMEAGLTMMVVIHKVRKAGSGPKAARM